MQTCKLIFEFGFQQEDVAKLLLKYTNDYIINNFDEDRRVGCNRNAVAVVDVPEPITRKLVNDGLVKSIDLMTSYRCKPSGAECCGSGGG